MRQCLCALACCGAAFSAAAADWKVHSSGQLQALTESNPRLATGDGTAAQAGLVAIDLQLNRRTELTQIALDARGALRRYTRDVSLDRDDQQLDLSLRRQTERLTWLMDLSAARDTTLTSELGTTGLIADNQRHRSLSLSLEPSYQLTERTALSSTAAWQTSRYARTRSSPLVNYDYSSLQFDLSHEITENSTAGMSLSAARLATDGPARDIRSADIRLQAEHRWSERWRGSVSAGVSRVQTANRTQSGSVFSAGMHRSAERYTLDGNVSRSVAPTGRGLLSRRDEAGLHLNVLALQHLTAAGTVSMVRSRDYVPAFGFSINDVRYTSAQLSLNWEMARQWTLGLSTGRNDQRFMSSDVSGHSLSGWLSVGWIR